MFTLNDILYRRQKSTQLPGNLKNFFRVDRVTRNYFSSAWNPCLFAASLELNSRSLSAKPSSPSVAMNSKTSSLDYGLVGESAAMKMLYRQIRMAARCDLTVLISGESGTGKELVARAIHLQSSRAKKP